MKRQLELLDHISNKNISSRIPVNFNVHHPQGMTKVDEYFYLSTVDHQGVDDPELRASASGTGYLIKAIIKDNKFEKIDEIQLGEGMIFHTGGIDHDDIGNIYVPVSEYIPHGKSIIYQIRISTFNPREYLKWDDHIGAITIAKDTHYMYGFSWGGEKIYVWEGEELIYIENAVVQNIDYQDSIYIGDRTIVCGGISTHKVGSESILVGGLDLIGLDTLLPIHRIMVSACSDKPPHNKLTYNPIAIDFISNCIYFLPDDDTDTMLYVVDLS
jgi:hypothetical protein